MNKDSHPYRNRVYLQIAIPDLFNNILGLLHPVVEFDWLALNAYFFAFSLTEATNHDQPLSRMDLVSDK